jgi:hypothetical protein
MIIKVTGHSLWRFAENRYCTLNISPIFITFSPNTKYGKVVKLANNKIMQELFRKIFNRGTVTLLSCVPAGFKIYL